MTFQIMLDVEGFSSDEIKIKVLNKDHLVIEGHSDKKQDSSHSINTFKRHFYLPGLIDATKINSSISSDGVLTIIVPKEVKYTFPNIL